MSHPPIPEAEFKPPWHQYFVKLKDYITTYFDATDTRLDAIEAQHELDAAAEGDDEDWPIGCIAMLSLSTTQTLTANEKIEVSGTTLLSPNFYGGGGGVIYHRTPNAVDVGTWRLVGPPATTFSNTIYNYYNWKRIS